MNTEKTKIDRISGTGIVVRGNDIDTDQIIPARFMKVVTFDGLGEYAFYDVRYDESRNKKDHPFNDPKYAGASVLVVNSNFGCGSSREHAPQALAKSGIRAVVGESFAEIFAGNCTAMGVPTIALGPEKIQEIMKKIEDDPSLQIALDLPAGVLTVGSEEYSFTLPPAYRNALMAGTWDSTSVLLSNLDAIEKTAGSLPYVSNFS